MTRVSRNSSVVADRYLDLVRTFPLRLLRSGTEYRRATEVVDRLATQAEGTLAPGEQDYLDTLALLIEDYDRRQAPALDEGIDGVAVLKHLMEANEMTVSELGTVLGSKGVASEVLSGKRSLSKAHMAKLSRRFNVDPSVFFPVR